jgi:hypothetical protein
MAGNIKLNVVGRVTTATAVAPDDNTDNNYQTKTLPATPDDDLYDSVSPRATPELPEDPEGFLVPYPDSQKGGKSSRKTKDEHKTGSISAHNTNILKYMQTLQGYIFCILQHFATKFCNFTNFI